MRRALLLMLTMPMLLTGCDNAPDDGDLQQGIERVDPHQEFEDLALHNCQGTIPLADLPIEMELLSDERLIMSREGKRVTLRAANGTS